MFLAAVAMIGYRKGWHMAIWRRRLPVAVISTPLLLLTLWLGWSLGSPLFTNVTVIEEFPFSHNAIVPDGMERSDVEEVMAGMAKVDDTVVEAMPNAAEISLGAAMIGGDAALTIIGMTEANTATLMEGLEMVTAAKADLDLSMMDKGLDMIRAAVGSPSGPANAQLGVEKI